MLLNIKLGASDDASDEVGCTACAQPPDIPHISHKGYLCLENLDEIKEGNSIEAHEIGEFLI